MKNGNAFDYTPHYERLSELIARGVDLHELRVIYNDAADELVVFLFPDVETSVAQDVEDDLYLLLDPETEEVVGFQIDDFINVAVVKRPQLLTLAPLADIDADLVEDARERIGEARSQQAAVQLTLRDLFAETSSLG